MKMLLRYLAMLAAAFAIGPVSAAGSPIMPVAGLYFQEYWVAGRAGYWIGNPAATPATITIAGSRAPSKANPSTAEVDVGPLTIAPGSATAADAGDFTGLTQVLVRNSDNIVIGRLLPPTPPPAASAEPGDVIRLPAVLNSVVPSSPSLWYEVSGLPPVGSTSLELLLMVNGPQPGFIAIRNFDGKALPSARISSVTCAGLPVKQAVNGDWFVDARKASIPPLQTVVIDYALAPVRQESLVIVDANLVDTKRVLLPLARAVLIGQPAPAVPSVRPPVPGRLNRPNGGRLLSL